LSPYSWMPLPSQFTDYSSFICSGMLDIIFQKFGMIHTLTLPLYGLTITRSSDPLWDAEYLGERLITFVESHSKLGYTCLLCLLGYACLLCLLDESVEVPSHRHSTHLRSSAEVHLPTQTGRLRLVYEDL